MAKVRTEQMAEQADDVRPEFDASEVQFLVNRCEDMRRRWEREFTWAESHQAIEKRERAAHAIGSIDALIEKLRRL